VRQLPFFGRIRVGILEIAFAQQVPGSLLEAVRLVLAVPDRQRQRELLADAVLVDGSERTAAQSFRFLVVRLEPDCLQLHVRRLGELVTLDDVVELFEVAGMEGHQGPSPQHRLVLVERVTRGRMNRKRPEEPAESFDVAAVLEGLADLRDLLSGEVEHRQRVEQRTGSGQWRSGGVRRDSTGSGHGGDRDGRRRYGADCGGGRDRNCRMHGCLASGRDGISGDRRL